MLLWMCHQKFPIHQEPPNLHSLTKFFALGFPNCEEPESYRPCHNLNPYRHRHYAPEVYSCYVLDKPQEVNILLYCYGCTTPNPHAPGNFQLYTDWQSFLLWGSSQLAEARRLQGMPQPQWAGLTRGWHAAQNQQLIPMSGVSVIPVMLLCLVAACWQDAMLLCGKCWTFPKSQKYCYSCYAVMDVQPQTSMHQKLSTLHRLDKFFTLESLTTCRSQNTPWEVIT